MIIPAEIHYKTYDDKLLAIIKAFKTWHYEHEIFVLTDHNKLYQFIDIKSLSSY